MIFFSNVWNACFATSVVIVNIRAECESVKTGETLPIHRNKNHEYFKAIKSYALC